VQVDHLPAHECPVACDVFEQVQEGEPSLLVEVEQVGHGDPDSRNLPRVVRMLRVGYNVAHKEWR
jgi:hypothetical protein